MRKNDFIIKKNTSKEMVLKLAQTDCQQCTHCCEFGGAVVTEDDVPEIAKFLQISQEELKKKYLEEHEKFNTKQFRIKSEKTDKPYAPCLFLDKKERCMLQDVKPLYCKIGTCKSYGNQLNLWFTLNYFVNPIDAESIRQYAFFLRHNKTIPGGELKKLVKDKRMLKKILNYKILK